MKLENTLFMESAIAVSRKFEGLTYARSVTVKSMGINICLCSRPGQLGYFIPQTIITD